MLMALVSFQGCHKFQPESLIADDWGTILSFKYDGETKVTITSGTTSLEDCNPITSEPGGTRMLKLMRNLCLCRIPNLPE